MYSFIKELSGSQSFPPTGLFPKTFKSKIQFFRYNKLPPIKEEEGNVNESEIDLGNLSSCSQFLNDGSSKEPFNLGKTNSNRENKRNELVGEGWAKTVGLGSTLPSVNINCLMNLNIKQQQPIWKTNFGKRLINGKPVISETVSLPIMRTENNRLKSKENQSWKSGNSIQSFFSDKNTQLEGEDKMAQKKKKKAEPLKGQKKWRKHERKRNLRHEPSETTSGSKTCKSETESAGTLADVHLPSPESLAGSLTTSRTSKNQNFLSRYVKSILGGITTQYNCEYCEETFTNEENFDSHKKKHEREKETCVLCNKVFYKPKEFLQHLLTHESVDKVSCKKCMKYFPSQKKYKTHCKNFHLMSSKAVEPENKNNLEHLKKNTPKYECKRCQLEFDSEENIRVHKRNHIKMDLMGAYLLSNKKHLT